MSTDVVPSLEIDIEGLRSALATPSMASAIESVRSVVAAELGRMNYPKFARSLVASQMTFLPEDLKKWTIGTVSDSIPQISTTYVALATATLPREASLELFRSSTNPYARNQTKFPPSVSGSFSSGRKSIRHEVDDGSRTVEAGSVIERIGRWSPAAAELLASAQSFLRLDRARPSLSPSFVASSCGNCIVNVLDWIFGVIAPDELVLPWVLEANRRDLLTEKGRPTRRARLLYAARILHPQMSRMQGDELWHELNGLYRSGNGTKHAGTPGDLELLMGRLIQFLNRLLPE